MEKKEKEKVIAYLSQDGDDVRFFSVLVVGKKHCHFFYEERGGGTSL